VSVPAVAWRDIQESNATLDVKRNVLIAAGRPEFADAKAKVVEKAYSEFEEVAFDFDSGQTLESDQYRDDFDPSSYSLAAASKKPELSASIPNAQDGDLVKRRPVQGVAYEKYDDQGRLACVVLPIKGMGLWGMMYGFLALESDLKTVRGIKYYDHKETPGLGAEVDNPKWRNQWEGKEIYGEAGNYQFEVAKGSVDPTAADAEHKVDGLSGATITCNGVEGSLAYWMGPNGYGPYLDQLARRTNTEAQ